MMLMRQATMVRIALTCVMGVGGWLLPAGSHHANAGIGSFFAKKDAKKDAPEHSPSVSVQTPTRKTAPAWKKPFRSISQWFSLRNPLKKRPLAADRDPDQSSIRPLKVHQWRGRQEAGADSPNISRTEKASPESLTIVKQRSVDRPPLDPIPEPPQMADATDSPSTTTTPAIPGHAISERPAAKKRLAPIKPLAPNDVQLAKSPKTAGPTQEKATYQLTPQWTAKKKKTVSTATVVSPARPTVPRTPSNLKPTAVTRTSAVPKPVVTRQSGKSSFPSTSLVDASQPSRSSFFRSKSTFVEQSHKPNPSPQENPFVEQSHKPNLSRPASAFVARPSKLNLSLEKTAIGNRPGKLSVSLEAAIARKQRYPSTGVRGLVPSVTIPARVPSRMHPPAPIVDAASYRESIGEVETRQPMKTSATVGDDIPREGTWPATYQKLMRDARQQTPGK